MLFELFFALQTKCFVIKEAGQIIYQEGEKEEFEKPHSPWSTFKIVLAAIGFDSGILQNAEYPVWHYNAQKHPPILLNSENSPIDLEGVDAEFFAAHKGAINPKKWIKHSCVWFSQDLTKALGVEKFQQYIYKFDYGNKDLSGDSGRDNGLTNAWLGSSLKISPQGQMQFLEKLKNDHLPISKQAHTNTRELLFLENLGKGWKLYGKRGGNFNIGWFVGWVVNKDRTLFIVHYVEHEGTDMPCPKMAKAKAVEKILPYLD